MFINVYVMFERFGSFYDSERHYIKIIDDLIDMLIIKTKYYNQYYCFLWKAFSDNKYEN